MFPQIDLTAVRVTSIAERANKVTLDACAAPVDAADASFAAFLDALPDILKARDLRALARGVADARAGGSPVVLMFGAHVIKTGCAPIVVDLLERGVFTAVAMNSAAAIHDVESALFGVTSEDVAENLRDGSFGMWKETGEFINGVLARDARDARHGYGEALGNALAAAGAPHLRVSVLAACARLGIPASVHAAIGTDIVHQQPSMDGAATGEMSFRDFRVLCAALRDLAPGAVVLNVGSAVILPEVFLKALTVVRNLGHPARGFTTANFDMIQHYRPAMNVLARPTQDGGTALAFTGHHELLIPLFAAAVKLAIARHG